MHQILFSITQVEPVWGDLYGGFGHIADDLTNIASQSQDHFQLACYFEVNQYVKWRVQYCHDKFKFPARRCVFKNACVRWQSLLIYASAVPCTEHRTCSALNIRSRGRRRNCTLGYAVTVKLIRRNSLARRVLRLSLGQPASAQGQG